MLVRSTCSKCYVLSLAACVVYMFKSVASCLLSPALLTCWDLHTSAHAHLHLPEMRFIPLTRATMSSA